MDHSKGNSGYPYPHNVFSFDLLLKWPTVLLSFNTKCTYVKKRLFFNTVLTTTHCIKPAQPVEPIF